MVDKFKTILAELEKDDKVLLFVVLKMDDFVDKWSVVICADKLKPGDGESFQKVFKIFDKILIAEEKTQIARIGIFYKNDYVPQLFSKFRTGDEIKEKTKINGFEVYEGYILKSDIENTTPIHTESASQ